MMFSVAEDSRRVPTDTDTFLTAADVPRVSPRFRVGARLVASAARVVLRVGYRVHPSDLLAAPPDPAWEAWIAAAPERVDPQEFRYTIARARCRAQGYGGRDRGVWVRPVPPFTAPVTVIDARFGVLGTRWSGSSGEDGESPALEDRRTVRLLRFRERAGVYLAHDFQPEVSVSYKIAIPDEGPRLVMVDAEWESTDTPVDPAIARIYRAEKRRGLIPGSVGFILSPAGEVRLFDFAEEDEARTERGGAVDPEALFARAFVIGG